MSSVDPTAVRQQVIAGTRRMVVKVGSRLLTDIKDTTKQERIEQLTAQLAAVRERGIEVILVTSGAIGAGLRLLGLPKRPTDVAMLQALAAIGQSRLMALYQRACQTHGFHCGQMLLSADDVRDRKRHLNIRNCLNALLSNGVLPIINENDTVSVEEIAFGDNDRLAALVGTMVRADLVVLLTTVDGLRSRDGKQLGQRLSLVNDLGPAIRGLATGTDGNAFSVGGMSTKLDAAEITITSGEHLWIADGTDFGVMQRLLAAEDVGTLFLPASPGRLSGSKRYLAFFSEPAGTVGIDEGAVNALRQRGKSLLPSGIRTVEGDFEKGDTVNIVDPAGSLVGMGVTNYSVVDLLRIQGLKSSQISGILGKQAYDEAIHRDNLVILD